MSSREPGQAAAPATAGLASPSFAGWRRAVSLIGAAAGSGPLLVLALAHCVDASFVEGQFLCDPLVTAEQCPPGQLCASDGRCRYSSLEPDADASTDASADAGSDACVPRSCDELLPACAADASNGCGEPLDCSNGCPGNSTCGGGGVAGQCGCPPVESQEGRPGRVIAVLRGELDAPWGNLDAGLAQDGVAAITQSIVAGRDTDYLVFDQLGLDVPPGAEIIGIVVRAWRSTQPGTPASCLFRTENLNLKWGPDADMQLSTKAPDTDNWPLSTEGGDVGWSYGSEIQRWDVPWTPEQVNAPDFGLRIQAQCNGPSGSTARARVDYADLTVYYEPACDL